MSEVTKTLRLLLGEIGKHMEGRNFWLLDSKVSREVGTHLPSGNPFVSIL